MHLLRLLKSVNTTDRKNEFRTYLNTQQKENVLEKSKTQSYPYRAYQFRHQSSQLQKSCQNKTEERFIFHLFFLGFQNIYFLNENQCFSV